MTNDHPVPEINLDQMPQALLAGLFPSGIVVIPEEFEGVTASPEVEDIAAVQAPQVPPVPKPATLPPLPPVSAVPPATTLSWLGKFGRQVLVVVNDPTALHINEADFALLGKILGAVKLSIADIALVNAATHQLEYYPLNEKLPASVALYFGIQPVDIGAPLKFPMFQVQNWNNTTFVYAPGLSELNVNSPEATALKKELWTALKKVFG